MYAHMMSRTNPSNSLNAPTIDIIVIAIMSLTMNGTPVDVWVGV